MKDKIKRKINNSKEIYTQLQNNNTNNNLNILNDNTILNLNDFQEHIRQNFKELNVDLSVSLDRPLLPTDIQRVVGNNLIFDSEGYIEEDDEDLKDNIEDSLIKTLSGVTGTLKYNFEYNYKKDMKERNFGEKERKSMVNMDTKLTRTNSMNFTPAKHDSINNFIINKNIIEGDKLHINTADELYEILYGKYKYNDNRYTLTYEEKEFVNSQNEKEIFAILKPEQLLLVLRYLYSELHSGLIELSDNIVEERRKYFIKKDHQTYMEIINYFLRKKEEFFLCVLSDIMSKLSISQKSLDNTFYYYMNIAQDDPTVLNIKEAYDKVYHAGIK